MLFFSFEFPEPLEGPAKKVDLEWKGFISNLMNQGDFKGELFERKLFYTQGALPAKRVLLTGLGKRGEFDLEKWRGAASKAGQYIRDAGIKPEETLFLDDSIQNIKASQELGFQAIHIHERTNLMNLGFDL